MTTVLLIDDEELVRFALRAAIEADGMTVVEAANGHAGVEASLSTDIDIIVTDILMPEMDGIELIREFKKSADDRPIIAISAGGRFKVVDHLDLARLLGADAVFAKPVDERELVGKIRELTRPS